MSFALSSPASNSNWPFPYAANGTWDTSQARPIIPTDGPGGPGGNPPPPIAWSVRCLLFQDDGTGGIATIVDQFAANVNIQTGTWSTDFSADNLTPGALYFLMVKLIQTVGTTITTVATCTAFNLTAQPQVGPGPS